MLQHVLERLQQRIDPVWTVEDIFSINKALRNGSGIFYKDESNNYKWYLIAYRGYAIMVLYDKKRSTIRTVLPQRSTGKILHVMKRSGVACNVPEKFGNDDLVLKNVLERSHQGENYDS